MKKIYEPDERETTVFLLAYAVWIMMIALIYITEVRPQFTFDDINLTDPVPPEAPASPAP